MFFFKYFLSLSKNSLISNIVYITIMIEFKSEIVCFFISYNEDTPHFYLASNRHDYSHMNIINTFTSLQLNIKYFKISVNIITYEIANWIVIYMLKIIHLQKLTGFMA